MEVKGYKVVALQRMGKRTVITHLKEHGANILREDVPWNILFKLWEEVMPDA